MGRRLAAAFIAASWSLPLGACGGELVHDDPGDNLVLITLDGVRTREVFGLPDPALPGGDDQRPVFARMHDALQFGGVLFGDRARFDTMNTANGTQLSLPGYVSIFTGREQASCIDNDCPQTTNETVLEYLQRLRGFTPGQIAAFASWDTIDRALEREPGVIHTELGAQGREATVPTWPGRWDADTFASAMTYLEEQRPRLLIIALRDADAWGHQGLADPERHRDYLASLRQYDAWIEELRTRLSGLGAYGERTAIVVTTDHGRGDGAAWWTHGAAVVGSEQIWMYATGAGVAAGFAPDSQHLHTSADLRPTLEAFFGIEPTSCGPCGDPVAEIVGDR